MWRRASVRSHHDFHFMWSGGWAYYVWCTCAEQWKHGRMRECFQLSCSKCVIPCLSCACALHKVFLRSGENCDWIFDFAEQRDWSIIVHLNSLPATQAIPVAFMEPRSYKCNRAQLQAHTHTQAHTHIHTRASGRTYTHAYTHRHTHL